MGSAQAQTRPPEPHRAHRRALNLSWNRSGSNAPLSPCFIYHALRTGRRISVSLPACTYASHPNAVYVPVKPTRCSGCFVSVTPCIGTSPRLSSVLLCFAGEARLGGKVVVGTGREMQWRMNGGNRRRGAWRCAKSPPTGTFPCTVCCRPTLSYRETASPDIFISTRPWVCLQLLAYASLDLPAQVLPAAAGTIYPTLCAGNMISSPGRRSRMHSDFS